MTQCIFQTRDGCTFRLDKIPHSLLPPSLLSLPSSLLPFLLPSLPPSLSPIPPYPSLPLSYPSLPPSFLSSLPPSFLSSLPPSLPPSLLSLPPSLPPSLPLSYPSLSLPPSLLPSLRGSEAIHIAIIHPREFCVHRLTVMEDTQVKFQVTYKNRLDRTACNIAYGHFGGERGS